MFVYRDVTADTKNELVGRSRSFHKVEEMFCVFYVWWKIFGERLGEMGDIGCKMVSWTITSINNRAGRAV